MKKWISVKEALPVHGQHVLVWDVRSNVYPFPRGIGGDDGEGRVQMGDAIYWSGEVCWKEMGADYRQQHWGDSKENYIECGNSWDRWEGHGPCSFSQVTHWMELPTEPDAT